jgi:hypothetical protein
MLSAADAGADRRNRNSSAADFRITGIFPTPEVARADYKPSQLSSSAAFAGRSI